MDTLFIQIIILLSLVGLSVSTYIYSKKRKKKKLICPRYSNCETVIHSDYSRIFGIPVEALGIIYYLFMALSYSVVLVFGLWSTQIAEILFGVSACSVVFSLYLVSLQVFVIRQLCAWCLLSALTSFLIFVVSYLHTVS